MPTLTFSGLVDYVSEKGTTAMERALSLAEEIAANGMFISSHMTVMTFYLASQAPMALRSAKLAISQAPDLSLESGKLHLLTLFPSCSRYFAGLDLERAAYEPLLQSRDREEALQAFREKRKPVFNGE
jgi:methylglutaconyl-CoA hydratase